MLALACDYRVMATGKYTIGLNESQLGIVAPRWLVDMFVQAVGTRCVAEACVLWLYAWRQP